MSKITVFTNLTYDGMMQAPGGQMKARGNFHHGGWAVIRSPNNVTRRIILGSGRLVFPDGRALASLSLRDARTTSKGILIANYQPSAA